MIEQGHGNLLNANVDALVNPVNCVGVMGKGLALQFKKAYPENFAFYERACRTGQVAPGQMLIFNNERFVNPQFIINFPTKRHWKGAARLADITDGLTALVAAVKQLGIRSLAVPPLGCGNGGLAWNEVKPLIQRAFGTVPDVRVVLFEPQPESRAAVTLPTQKKPGLTPARAMLIRLLELYLAQGDSLTKLEVQKLAYFLQANGQPLRLRYVKHQYGPYADNLNHLLLSLDGHYLQGFGDRQTKSEIRLLPGAAETAWQFLQDYPEAVANVEKVSELVAGFESPFSLELLATVHWVTQEMPAAAADFELALTALQSWSDRKKAKFKPEHVRRAWQRLREQGWLGAAQSAVTKSAVATA